MRTKNLKDMLAAAGCELVQGSADREITGIVYDSRKVTDGCLFVCLKGAVSDGHRFAADAVNKGAAAVLIQDPVELPAGVTVARSDNTRRALSLLSQYWFDYPAKKLKTIGITGTKGKTTTSYMIQSILNAAGHRCGLIGTIESITGKRTIPSENTTPESYLIQEYFSEMVESGFDSVVMEVSSQALKMDRVAGIEFDFGIFTNIAPDHIGPNEHSSFEEYMECKKKLLRQSRIGIVNRDDPHYQQIVEGNTCEILETYGFDREATLRATNVTMLMKRGMLGICYQTEGIENIPVEIDIPGRFSVYNSLAAIAVCHHFGVSADNIMQALTHAKVKGRVEMVKVSDKFTLMIDYAHNAMALESLLSTLREYHPARIVCLFGCGGNRDRERRFEMGETSGKMADFTIITSDNPRNEDPEAIMDDIETGIKKTDGAYIRITDRKEAIAWAIHNAEPGDIIVLAGKGHEDYQIIKGKKYPMDERVLIQEILDEDRKAGRTV
ncbi:MAG: UDP-N-acetylmuramoyl-L-alanyl-D-glutamate--2,6-diaminopimelate ligase [Eubacteriales bacterium]|jgi:UDP-N-acetylmuramoyl-L-alanyl-D-glutamate--2,6-diaminopimelate ligase